MSAVASVLFGPLEGLLTRFQQERHYKNEKKDEALIAINTALFETTRYIEESESEKYYDRGREYDLGQLWSEASVKARDASEDLAARLHTKELYWSDQMKWSREEVLARRIDLDSIQKQVEELLQGS